MYPLMIGIFMERQLAIGAGHRPQVIQAIPGGRRHRMIAVRQQHRVAVANLVRHAFPGRGVDRLLAESMVRRNPKVIDLFETRFAVGAIVLVRRVTAPVARRG